MPTIQTPESFSSYPTHRMFGIVDNPHDADALIAALDKSDAAQDTWVLNGNAAERVLDSHGEHNGVLASFVRSIQSFGYETAQLETYEQAAQKGSWIVAPKVTTRDQKEHVAALFANHYGREVRYMGRLGIENMYNATSAL